LLFCTRHQFIPQLLDLSENCFVAATVNLNLLLKFTANRLSFRETSDEDAPRNLRFALIALDIDRPIVKFPK
jgi:hypothetical protein